MQKTPISAAKWLDGVVAKPGSMTQRKLSSVQKMAGGLAGARKLAKERGIHLLLLEDDRGEPLIAASAKAFRVIC